ncbi:MAG: hypothetical protein JXR96_25805 [Deltaproteobacteria bacterium]|nr:hypothetical protein [Deltaproteobacteria bacterium]
MTKPVRLALSVLACSMLLMLGDCDCGQTIAEEPELDCGQVQEQIQGACGPGHLGTVCQTELSDFHVIAFPVKRDGCDKETILIHFSKVDYIELESASTGTTTLAGFMITRPQVQFELPGRTGVYTHPTASKCIEPSGGYFYRHTADEQVFQMGVGSNLVDEISITHIGEDRIEGSFTLVDEDPSCPRDLSAQFTSPLCYGPSDDGVLVRAWLYFHEGGS